MIALGGETYTRCSSHPQERAAWRCTACARALCPDCAGSKIIQPLASTRNAEVIICLACNNLSLPIMKPRELTPWWIAVVPFTRHLFTGAGLTQLLAVSILISFFTLFRPILGFLVMVSYVFQVIRSASNGSEKLPEPADFEGWSDLILPVFRLGAALSLIWAPALFYIVYGIGLRELWDDPTLINDPMLYAILAFGSLYVPAAIIAAAVAQSVLAVINPLITIRMIARIPGQYALTFLVSVVLLFAHAVTSAGFELVFSYIPLVGFLFAGFCQMFIPVIGGFILGRLIFQNADHFGVFGLHEREVPEWPGARPSGSAEGAPLPVGARAPIEVPELDVLEESLRRGDDRRALEAFREKSAGGAYPLLEPRWELRMATILERAGDAKEAARACERAAKNDLHGPLAPRAIFTAARILVERAGEPVEGVKLYEYLIAHYPNDDFAMRAQDALRKI